jgi:hypothetical protein
VAGGFVLIGALLSFASTWGSDRRRAKQEAVRLEQEERRETTKAIHTATARFLVETRGVFEAYKSNFRLGSDGSPHQIDGQVVDATAVNQAYWELAFVATPEIRALARGLQISVRAFSNQRHNETRLLVPFSAKGWASARAGYFTARRDLVKAVLNDSAEEDDQ